MKNTNTDAMIKARIRAINSLTTRAKKTERLLQAERRANERLDAALERVAVLREFRFSK